jgi:hypothetical protein
VSRLTLLFFSAAKDVPEAAETVTARTARLHYAKQTNDQNCPRSSRAATPEKVKQQGNHRDD